MIALSAGGLTDCLIDPRVDMRNAELSLPQFVDLAASQRERAEKALRVLRRQLSAQKDKLDRMRELTGSLQDQLSGSDRREVSRDQVEAHRRAARQELRTAQEVIDKLRAREENLLEELEEKKRVENSLTSIYEQQSGRRPLSQAG